MGSRVTKVDAALVGRVRGAPSQRIAAVAVETAPGRQLPLKIELRR